MGRFNGRQGDAGPYGSEEVQCPDLWDPYRDQKFRQRLELARRGGDPVGVVDLACFSAPFAAPLISDVELSEVLEAIEEGGCERLLLAAAPLTGEGMLEIVHALARSSGPFWYVDLTGCQAVCEMASELLQEFPYHRGASLEVAECGLTEREVIQLLNETDAAAEARSKRAQERERSAKLSQEYMSRQEALEQLAVECNPYVDSPPLAPEADYHPSRWVLGLELQARLSCAAYRTANPQGLREQRSEGYHGTYSMKGPHNSNIRLNHDQYQTVVEQALRMLGRGEAEVGEEYDMEGEMDVCNESPTTPLQLPPLYQDTFQPDESITNLVGFMLWHGVKPNEEEAARRKAEREAFERQWKERKQRMLDLEVAAKAKHDGGQRAEKVNSGMLIAHFTYLAEGCQLKGKDEPKPPSYFGLKRVSEASRAPPFRGKDLHEALASHRVRIDAVCGSGFGKDSLALTLFSGSSNEDVEVAIRSGTIFQHKDWQHRQNLIVALDYIITVPAGGVASKKLMAYCMNVTCACSNGNFMELTEFFF